MLPIPEYISVQFNNVLRQRAIPEAFHVHYRKWLRYFLDFCEKYPPPETKSERVRLFIDKLKSKNTQNICGLGTKISTLSKRQAAGSAFST
jgi:hypothetical protein